MRGRGHATVAAVAAMLLTARGAVATVWVSHGPESGPITAIAVAPTNPATIYAGAYGVYRSTDGGATWSSASAGITDAFVADIVVDPTDPATVYVATSSDGVLRTTDGGQTWASLGLTTLQVRTVAVDPTDPARLYVATYNGGGIFASLDDGATWQAASAGLGTQGVSALAIDPTTPSVVYAATYGAGVYKTTTSGASWTAANAGIDKLAMDLRAMVMDPHDPQTLWVASSGGVYKTTTGGASWQWVNAGPGKLVEALAIDPAAPDVLYESTFDGIFRSTDGGASWAAASDGLTDPWTKAVAFDPTTPGTAYAASNASGVFKTSTGGAAWAPANGGLTTSWVQSIAIDPSGSGTMYTATFGQGVFRGTTRGDHWTAMNAGLVNHILMAVAIDPVTSTTVYVGTFGNGVATSTDAGATWTTTSAGLANANVMSVAAAATDPVTIYAGTQAGLYRSTGSMWTYLGFFDKYVTAVAVDPVDPLTVYITASGNGLYKTTDGGATWTLANAGLGCAWPDGLFRSDDAGASWQRADTGIPSLTGVLGVATDPFVADTAYAAIFAGGLFRTTDGGAHWAPVAPETLHNALLRAVAVDSATGTLYAGSNGGGVFVLQRCGDGVLDPGEACDDGNTASGDCCSSFCEIEPAGTACRPATSACDAVERCDGASATCPADASVCGNGTVETACGEECDDGNAVNGDGCSSTCTIEVTPTPTFTPRPATPTVTPTSTSSLPSTVTPTLVTTPTPLPTAMPLCGVAPDTGCRKPIAPAASLVEVKDRALDTRDVLTWKWSQGAATLATDFGDPVTTTAYALCIYDRSGGTPTLVVAADVRAGGVCGGRPCWRERATGFKYVNRAASPAGIRSLLLKSGPTGHAKVVVNARGSDIAVPALPLLQDPSVTVEVRNDRGVCWAADYSAPALTNDAAEFRDRSD